MIYSISVNDSAKNDLKKIIIFYSQFTNELFLEKLENLIGSGINSLNFLPERNKIFSENYGIRVLIINGKFKIYYEIDNFNKQVIVLKIALSVQNDVNFFN